MKPTAPPPDPQSRHPVNTDGLPHFLIIGAMKAGTSSVHHILAQHPGVYIPPGEVFFFDVDDVEQHPNFFVPSPGGWTFHDFERDLDVYLTWYRGLFAQATPDQLRGEDSTTYLPSRLAPTRIARLLPHAKLIVMLRDPVSRAYSHYWHNVSRGRVTRSFEHTLQHSPGSYLSRGFYAEQLTRYRRYFSADQLRVVFFEEFVDDPQGTMDGLCDFLGLEQSVDVSRINAHRNPSRPPIYPPARLLLNGVLQPLRPLWSNPYNRRIPNMPGYGASNPVSRLERHPLVARMADWYDAVPFRRRPPALQPDTRAHLQRLFRKRNAALSDVLERDVAEVWPYMGESE